MYLGFEIDFITFNLKLTLYSSINFPVALSGFWLKTTNRQLPFKIYDNFKIDGKEYTDPHLVPLPYENSSCLNFRAN